MKFILFLILVSSLLFSCQEKPARSDFWLKEENRTLREDIRQLEMDIKKLEADDQGIQTRFVFASLIYESGASYDPAKKTFPGGTYRFVHLSPIQKVYDFEVFDESLFLKELEGEIKEIKGPFLKSVQNPELHSYITMKQAYEAKTKLIDAHAFPD
ncbi:MAG: hypothetical protein EP338_09430 [Bacteroidetes bacterium]|nr:MAG: hypothetical protein EP338_09430 [Bacteroidota bacterium]